MLVTDVVELKEVCGVQTLDQSLRGGGRLRKMVAHIAQLRHEGRFTGCVLGPLGAEVSISPGCPPHAASALENCVPNRVWGAFVVEHSEDQRLIRECAPIQWYSSPAQ